MLRRMRLRTKLAMLVALAVLATLVVAVPGLVDQRREAARAATEARDVATAGRTASFLAAIQREATLTRWFLATGDRAAQQDLAAVRPFTDRAALELVTNAGPDSAADSITALRSGWQELRRRRPEIDRRTIDDDGVREQFAALTVRSDEIIGQVASQSGGAARGDLQRLRRRTMRQTTNARAQAAVVAALGRGTLTDEAADALGTARQARTTEAGSRAAGPVVRRLGDLELLVLRGGHQAVPPREWIAASTRIFDDDVTAVEAASSSAQRHARRDARRADRDIQNRLVLSLGIALAVLGTGMLLARAIRLPLRELARSARARAERHRADAPEQDRLADPQPLDVRTRDEVGAVARAVRDLDWQALDRARAAPDDRDLAGSVDLARRNQPLIDRQRAVLNRLLETEPSPTRHAGLADADLIARQMHRNTDSVLVLAGSGNASVAPSARPIGQVVRDAVADVGRFVAVDVVGLPSDTEVTKESAITIEHLLAELIDIAGCGAPAGTRVVVTATASTDGLVLTVTDAREALDDAQLALANATLEHPPAVGEDHQAPDGLVVVARLATRINATVALQRSGPVGSAAVITLPPAVLQTTPTTPLPTPSPAPRPRPETSTVPAAAPVATVATDDRAASVLDPHGPPPGRPVRFSPVPPPRETDLLPGLRRHRRRPSRRPSAPPATEAATAPREVSFAPVPTPEPR